MALLTIKSYPIKISRSEISFLTVLALSSAIAVRRHVEYEQLSRHATLVRLDASILRACEPGWCRSWVGHAHPRGSLWSLHHFFVWDPNPSVLPLERCCMSWDLQSSAGRLFWSPLWYHGYILSFDCADSWQRDLRCPIPVGASLGPVHRSTPMLRITWALTSHSFLQMFQVFRGLP